VLDTAAVAMMQRGVTKSSGFESAQISATTTIVYSTGRVSRRIIDIRRSSPSRFEALRSEESTRPISRRLILRGWWRTKRPSSSLDQCAGREP
jgi:hypothetical protein